jgi:hypothetical protein
MTRRLLLLAGIAGLALASGAPATAASAAGAGTGPAAGRYCVASAAAAGNTAIASLTCYHTFAGSIRAATGGRAGLPVSATPRSVTQGEINAWDGTPATQYVLSIDFQHTGFAGSSLTWVQSSRCGYFQAGSMPSGWNDAVSSVIASSGCATTLFWNVDFGGSSYAIARNGSASNLGGFNDQASSQTWCPTYPCGR